MWPIISLPFRRLVFWLHLTVGVIAGTVIFVLSLTGMLLGYERQIVAAFDSRGTVTVPADGVRLGLDQLLVRASIDQRSVSTITVRAAPEQAVLVRPAATRALPVFLDPYSGASLPPPVGGPVRTFMSKVRQWHLVLGAPEGAWTPVAHAVSGVAVSALLLLVPMGLWLWWPARWTRASIGRLLWFQPALRGRARDFNWHNSVGVWSAAPLFVMALTSVLLVYQWPNELIQRIGTSPRPAAPASDQTTHSPDAPFASWSVLHDAVTRRHPAWRVVTFTRGRPDQKPVVVQAVVLEGNTFRPDLRTVLLLDAVTALPVRVVEYAAMPVGRRLLAWVRYTHTGEAFGLAGQTVATLASAAGVLLTWTGLALAWRRFRTRVSRR
ncbi:MAG: PepSY domain-containing protein [Acidobacteria bacterium]|nr:PepSY domain-containing protein [Acidobacteriota bacterium]